MFGVIYLRFRVSRVVHFMLITVRTCSRYSEGRMEGLGVGNKPKQGLSLISDY